MIVTRFRLACLDCGWNVIVPSTIVQLVIRNHRHAGKGCHEVLAVVVAAGGAR